MQSKGTTPGVSDEKMRTLAKRAELMAAVLNGTTDRRQLASTSAASRSTVYRGLDQLVEHDFLTESAGTYTPTTFGKLVYPEFRQYVESFQALENANESGLFAAVPDNAPIDQAALIDGEITTPDRCAPTAVLSDIKTIVTEASQLRFFTPVVLPSFLDLYCHQLSDGNLTAEAVFETDVLHWIQENHPDKNQALEESEATTVQQTTDTLPYELGVTTDPTERMYLVLYGTKGNIRGVVTNDTGKAVSWAETTYQEYSSEATSLSTG